eukprot:scaffold28336_cov69-Phaeocystis_antarctica.AAC.7
MTQKLHSVASPRAISRVSTRVARRCTVHHHQLHRANLRPQLLQEHRAVTRHTTRANGMFSLDTPASMAPRCGTNTLKLNFREAAPDLPPNLSVAWQRLGLRSQPICPDIGQLLAAECGARARVLRHAEGPALVRCAIKHRGKHCQRLRAARPFKVLHQQLRHQLLVDARSAPALPTKLPAAAGARCEPPPREEVQPPAGAALARAACRSGATAQPRMNRPPAGVWWGGCLLRADPGEI